MKTDQGNIARLERGRTQATIRTLQQYSGRNRVEIVRDTSGRI